MNEATRHDDEPSMPRKPHRRSPGLAILALLIALAALAVAVWSVWRLHRFAHDQLAANRQQAAILAGLQSQLAAGDEQARAGAHRIARLDSALDDLHATTQGLDRRIANLETAYGNLSGQRQSGQDTVLLDDAEMLLRTGAQRYELFHDSAGALKAYAQAIDVLAQVQNPVYAPVRASAETERDALAAAAPPWRQAALDTLSALRGKVASLPLASEGDSTSVPTAPQKAGFWSRVGHAFSGIVKVSRDNAATMPLAGTGFARQTLALDLVQAQEALLDADDATYRAALQRADAALAAQFDGENAGVKAARAQITDLLAQHHAGPAPKLGGALAQLQSLRASHPAAPAPAATTGDAKR